MSLSFGIEKPFLINDPNQQDLELSFELPEYTIKQDGNYHHIESSGNGITLQDHPEVPVFTTFIKSDNKMGYNVQIISKNQSDIEGIKIRASAKLIRPGDPIAEREEIPHIYERNENYPKTLVQISNPMVMRGVTVQKISVFPFQHNPITKTLTVTQNLEIELKAVTDTNETSSYIGSRAFESIYENLIINYSRPDNFQQSAILYICGGDACDTDAFHDLKEWRHQQGFIIYTASTYEMGYDAEAISNTIQYAYDYFDPPPEYVTLIGDVQGNYSIPTYAYDNPDCNGGPTWGGGVSYGDYPYTLVDGDDLISDILIGRLSVMSEYELDVVVNKLISYEQAIYMDYMDNAWYERAALSTNTNGNSGLSFYNTNESIEYMMTNAGMSDIRTYAGGGYASWLSNRLDEGILYLNHRDWSGGGSFNAYYIDSANNGLKLPFVTLITCWTNFFNLDVGYEVAEYIFKAGSVNNPQGGIAAVGMAGSTHTLFNNIIDMGIYHGIFVNGTTSAGGALLEGKLALMNAYPDMANNPFGCNEVENYSYMTNLMGDAALELWTDTPKTMIVNHPETIQFGSNLVSISILDTNLNPISDVQITLLKQDGNIEDIFLSDFTNESGLVEFGIDYNTIGEIILTARKNNYKPIIANIEIIDNENSELLIGDEIGIIDGVEGKLNPGETVTLQIPIQNIGSGNISGVQVELSSSSNWINIINDTVILGELSSGESMNAEFEFSLFPDMVFSEQISFLVHIICDNTEDWYFQVSVPVYSHWFDIEDVLFITDGNAGQQSEIDISLFNSGNLASEEFITLLEYSGSSNIEILSDTLFWPEIAINTSYNLLGNHSFILGSDVISGSILSFNLSLLFAESSPIILPFTLIAGEAGIGEPLGPDGYGYYIYDSGDTLYNLAPYYYWEEIDPLYGGQGTPLNLIDSGDGNPPSQSSPVINLPFPVYFYGVEYNKITISTNGWISFGESELESFRNYPIPGPGGPSPMLAVFWDDLITFDSGEVIGDVFYSFDSLSSSLIIEWSNMKTYQHNSPITMQIILFENNNYSPSVNNDILVQYLDFNNTTNGYYPSDYCEGCFIHGGFATIGIESHNANHGLQYTFNNEYSISSMPLYDKTALLITNRPSVDLFNIDLQDVLPGQTVEFTANNNYNAETWAWDFNMDGIVDSDSSHAEWIYNASGRYNVCLTINDGMTDYTDLRYNFIHVYEYGCTNRYSCTFDPDATIDDGSCLYDIGCGCGEDQFICWDDTIVCDINECTVEPDISISPDMLSLELSAGSSESYEITLFNNGGSILNWSSNDYFIADSLSLYDIGCNFYTNCQARGITWDGEHFWYSNHFDDMIYQIDIENPSSILHSIPAPDVSSAGLAWDGEYIWNVDWMGDMIYKLNPSDGSIMHSISSPSDHTWGLTWDGEHLWCSSPWTSNQMIYKVDSHTGEILLEVPSPIGAPVAINWKSDYLWYFNSNEILYKFHPTNGELFEYIIPPPPIYGWPFMPPVYGLTWDDEYFWALTPNGVIKFSIIDWLYFDTTEGGILPASSQIINIVINTYDLSSGNYSNEILIENNDPDEGLLVFPITLSINSLDGDVNGDTLLNILDLVLIANMILADDFNTIADMNEDGTLNILDLVILVNIILEV